MHHGFINLDKPAGITSHDAVAALRRIAQQKRVGHGGTLDPLATGVLPIGLGLATRLLEYLVEEGRKVYLAGVLLGRTTSTDDAEGRTLAERPVPRLSAADLERAIAPFVGRIQQVPPLFSAIQVGGQRMYDLARRADRQAASASEAEVASADAGSLAGDEAASASEAAATPGTDPLEGAEAALVLQLKPREVLIERITLLDWQSPLAALEVVCGKGTYIRSLARDLGAALGCGAHLHSLRRSAVGPLTLETAVSLEQLRADPALLSSALLPPEAAVADWARADVDAAGQTSVLHGKMLPLELPAGQSRCRIHGPDGGLLALAQRVDERLWKPSKVFIVES